MSHEAAPGTRRRWEWDGVVAARAIFVGNTLYLSGQTGRGDGVEAQAEEALNNIKGLVEQAGGSMRHVVKLVLYFKDAADWEIYRKVQARFWPTEPPASTGVVVAGLLLPHLLLEIDATAVIGD